MRPVSESADPIAQPTGESAFELLQRGRSLLRQSHNAQAAIVLERAARIEPGKGSILEALGRAYFNSGQTGPALETFRALLDLDPSAPYAYYAIGRCLKKLGRVDEARASYRVAVALDPASRLYGNALKRLGPPSPG
jgi:Flp pilus assembly protein TadD